MTVIEPLVPDFDSIVVENVDLPYRDESYLRFSFSDPMLKGYEVTVIADSVPVGTNWSPNDSEGKRLLTITSRFPRCVLSEVNTHRVFSRNSASSRARAIKATIADVMLEPYVPLFTKNQKGMSGLFLTAEEREKAVEAWLLGRDSAVVSELRLLLGDLLPSSGSISEIASDYGALVDRYYREVYEADTMPKEAISVHKQNANRVIEPYMWHEAIITSSYWDNFVELRSDLSAAQPEIVALGKLVEAALKESTPSETWAHLPFVEDKDKPQEFVTFADIRDLMLLSATESAQISYRDKSKAEKSTATTRLGERLLAMKHLSPFEHVAFSSDAYHESSDEKLPKGEILRSNLDDSWVQLRPVITGM